MVVGKTVLHPHVAHLCATEGGEVSSRGECAAQIPGQGTDIGALAADYAQDELHLFGIKRHHFYLVDADVLGFELYVLAIAAHVVGADAVDLYCTVGRRYLFYLANKLLQRLKNQLSRDMLRGEGGADRVLHVVAHGRRPQLYRGDILLRVLLQRLDLLRLFSRRKYQDASGERIECASVSHLHLATQGVGAEVADVGEGLETRHAIGLVDGDEYPFFEIDRHPGLVNHLE